MAIICCSANCGFRSRHWLLGAGCWVAVLGLITLDGAVAAFCAAVAAVSLEKLGRGGGAETETAASSSSAGQNISKYQVLLFTSFGCKCPEQ